MVPLWNWVQVRREPVTPSDRAFCRRQALRYLGRAVIPAVASFFLIVGNVVSGGIHVEWSVYGALEVLYFVAIVIAVAKLARNLTLALVYAVEWMFSIDLYSDLIKQIIHPQRY